MDIKKLTGASVKAAKNLWNVLPVLIGALLLISLVNTLVPKSFFSYLFKGDPVWEPFIGSALGSILAGNPVTSYILAGELLKEGVSLIAVTAFLVAWVTVGIIQLPAESILLGKRFALARNITAFIFAVIVALITVMVVNGL